MMMPVFLPTSRNVSFREAIPVIFSCECDLCESKIWTFEGFLAFCKKTKNLGFLKRNFYSPGGMGNGVGYGYVLREFLGHNFVSGLRQEPPPLQKIKPKNFFLKKLGFSSPPPGYDHSITLHYIRKLFIVA